MEYQYISRKTDTKVKEAKYIWITNQCNKTEQLQAKYATRSMHKKIKDLAETIRRKQSTVINDKNNTDVLNVKQKLLH